MSYLKKYRYYIFSIIASIVSTIFAIEVQFLRADVVDSALHSNNAIWNYAFLFVVFILLEIFFTYVYLDYQEKYTLQVGLEIKNNILNYESAYYKEMTSHNKSSIINTILKQVDLAKERYYKNIIYLIHLTIKSILILVAMLNINVYLTLFIVIMLMNQIFLPKILSKYLNKLNKNYIKHSEEFTERLDNFLSNFPLIFNFSIVHIIHKKLFASLVQFNESEYKKFYGNNLIRHINMLNSYMTHFITLIICAYLLFQKQITIATFYVIMGLVEQLTLPLINISFAYQNIIGNKDLINNLKIYEKHDNLEWKNKIYVQKFNFSLNIQNLCYYTNDKQIIKGFNYKFYKNKKYLIQGVSGSGKTTLLNIIHQSIVNYDGKIYIDDYTYTDVNVKNIIGFMSDNPSFIKGTIEENIVLGENVDKKNVIYFLNKLSLNKITDRLDEEISYIEERFSLGERKRIEIMRLLLRDYSILLLDEPTSNLDIANRQILIEIIKALNDKTIICTSHETSKDFIDLFDEVITYEL